MLMQMERRKVRERIPKRSEDEKKVIGEAKRLLMERNYMSEDEAYRFLQKRSMDSGERLFDIAAEILDDNTMN